MRDNEPGNTATMTVIACILAFAFLLACERRQAVVVSAAPVVEPPIVRELREVWQTERKGENAKVAWANARAALGEAFARAVAKGHLPELERFVHSSIASGELNELACHLQEDLVYQLIAQPDRSGLVRVVSWGLADCSSVWSIEDVLTSGETWNRNPDGLAILFDAYDIAISDRAKNAIYLAAWRAIGDLPTKAKDPTEYMRVARVWYESNRLQLERHRQYDHTDLSYGREVRPGDSRLHLFSLPNPTPR